VNPIINDFGAALALLKRTGFLWERLAGGENMTGHDVTKAVAERLIREGYADVYDNGKSPRKLYLNLKTSD